MVSVGVAPMLGASRYNGFLSSLLYSLSPSPRTSQRCLMVGTDNATRDACCGLMSLASRLQMGSLGRGCVRLGALDDDVCGAAFSLVVSSLDLFDPFDW
jgi:hypothetical protein